MINILEIFVNNTMVFLNKIEQEINNITNIAKNNFLYDFFSIYVDKLILRKFNKYLFKSI